MKHRLQDFLNTAKTKIDCGQYAKALQSLESALRCAREPRLKIEVYFHTAFCRYRLEEYAEAAENLEKALSFAGEMAYSGKKHIYDLLRAVYALKQDHVKLAELCRMLMSAEKDKTGLMDELLHAYAKSKKWNEIVQVLDEFPDIELAAKSLLCKIRSFSFVGRCNDALQVSREYIEKFGEDHYICANLMDIYFRINAGKKGFEYYGKAIARCDNPFWRLQIGGGLLVQDLYQGVISDGEYPDIVSDMRRSTEKLQVNTVFDNTPKPFRRIKLGYLSADLRVHPVGYFLTPVMSSTVSSHCFNFCFSLAQPNDEGDDPVTAQFKSLANMWEEVYERPDSYIEQLFLTNRIDIAFDMMCHSKDNRIQLHARRLAPVQISWIGFPVTTGLASMDYVIADKNTDPPGSEKYYTEKLLYMPESFLCHTVTSGLDAAPPAFTRNGYITFACFHNLQKITDKTLDMWRLILEKCENSRLKIMGRMPEENDESREIFNERLRKIGMPMERVSISPPCAFKDYFAAYNDVDIMLDTYPFSGATTTFEALGMGRPIITLVGERHVTRVSYSLLKHVELEDLAAFSEDEYVQKAVALAGDHERLIRINAELPRRVDDSPLVNQPAFRKNFEKIIRDVWARYCFENRKGYYDYSADNPPELLEQVVNATVYIERKLEAGEGIETVLAAEYHRAQRAFFNKLHLITNDEEFVREYEKLVRMIGRRLDENGLRLAISAAKRYLNVFCNGELVDLKKH